MRKAIVFVLVLIGISLITKHAAAQGGILGIALCRKIVEEQARLKCYDAALDSISGTKENENDVAPPEQIGWRINEDKSPIDDSPQITATLFSAKGRSGLSVRCKEKKTELLFFPDNYLGGTSSGTVRVVVRVNDAPAVTESWGASTSGRAAFSPNPIQMIKSLPDNGRLFIRAFDFQGAHAEAHFELGAFSEIRDKIRQTCKWTDPKPPAPAKTQAPLPLSRPQP